MSQETDRSLKDKEMEEALAANDSNSQRQYLIRKVAKISDRLDNGMSERIEVNTKFRNNLKKWLIRIAIIVGPLALAGIMFLVNQVYL